MPFSFRRLSLEGLVVVEPKEFADSRGSFMETYRRSDFVTAGIPAEFAQDNRSRSAAGVLRGLHFQRGPKAQGKLVRVSAGRVWDVAVDLRAGSPTFGQWHGFEQSAENRLMAWIPPGFAHGFLALEDGTELEYKCTSEYDPGLEDGIRWDDPILGIAWPTANPTLSERDACLPSFDPDRRYFERAQI